jgi:sporulation protein YlmC with PRC-barrel domain
MTRPSSSTIVVALILATSSVQAQQSSSQSSQQQAGPVAEILTSLPQDAKTVTVWYERNVYDPSDAKIGEIEDVLVDGTGKVDALIIGVGGFLGIGEKDVAVPFNAVKITSKGNERWYLMMNATKDALKSAKGFKYDRVNMSWIPEESPATTGSPAAPAQRPGR